MLTTFPENSYGAAMPWLVASQQWISKTVKTLLIRPTLISSDNQQGFLSRFAALFRH